MPKGNREQQTDGFWRKAATNSSFEQQRDESRRWIEDWSRQAKGTPQEDVGRLLESLADQLHGWGAIESITSLGNSIHVDIVDVRRDVRVAGRVAYPSVRVEIAARSSRCPKDHVAVRVQRRLWIELCRNGLGYWTYRDSWHPVPVGIEFPVALLTASHASAADGESSGPDPGTNRAGIVADDVPWLGESAQFSSLRSALTDCMVRKIYDFATVVEVMEAEFSLSAATVDSIRRCFADDPGDTEFHVIMAVSAAANDPALPVADRLGLDEVAGLLIRDGIRQCQGCLSCFPPSPHLRRRGYWQPEDVPPERLLDTIDRLLVHYTGEPLDDGRRSLGGTILSQLRHSLTLPHLRALLMERGLDREVAEAVPEYDPTRPAADYAHDAENNVGYRKHLSAAVAALADSDRETAARFLELAEQALTTIEPRYRDRPSTEIALVKDNADRIAEALAAVRDQYAASVDLYRRIVGRRD